MTTSDGALINGAPTLVLHAEAGTTCKLHPSDEQPVSLWHWQRMSKRFPIIRFDEEQYLDPCESFMMHSCFLQYTDNRGLVSNNQQSIGRRSASHETRRSLRLPDRCTSTNTRLIRWMLHNAPSFSKLHLISTHRHLYLHVPKWVVARASWDRTKLEEKMYCSKICIATLH